MTGSPATRRGLRPQARIIHIDLDPAEIGKNVPVAVGFVGRRAGDLRALPAALAPRDCDDWRAEIDELHADPARRRIGATWPPRPSSPAINEASGGAVRRSSPMWASTRCGSPSSTPTNGPTATSPRAGWAPWASRFPRPWACHFARPDEPVWAISGDGGFQMNLQEMATMVQEGIPVKMAIFNNGYLGMVRQWQQFFHGRRYSATPIWSPDYVQAGGSLWDRRAIGSTHARQIEEAAGAAPPREPGPALVEFMIEQEANVFPMIPPGGSLSEPIEAAAAAGATVVIRGSAARTITVVLPRTTHSPSTAPWVRSAGATWPWRVFRSVPRTAGAVAADLLHRWPMTPPSLRAANQLRKMVGALEVDGPAGGSVLTAGDAAGPGAAANRIGLPDCWTSWRCITPPCSRNRPRHVVFEATGTPPLITSLHPRAGTVRRARGRPGRCRSRLPRPAVAEARPSGGRRAAVASAIPA